MVGVDMPAVDLRASCDNIGTLSAQFEESDEEPMGDDSPRPAGSPSAEPDEEPMGDDAPRPAGSPGAEPDE